MKCKNTSKAQDHILNASADEGVVDICVYLDGLLTKAMEENRELRTQIAALEDNLSK